VGLAPLVHLVSNSEGGRPVPHGVLEGDPRAAVPGHDEVVLVEPPVGPRPGGHPAVRPKIIVTPAALRVATFIDALGDHTPGMIIRHSVTLCSIESEIKLLNKSRVVIRCLPPPRAPLLDAVHPGSAGGGGVGAGAMAWVWRRRRANSSSFAGATESGARTTRMAGRHNAHQCTVRRYIGPYMGPHNPSRALATHRCMGPWPRHTTRRALWMVSRLRPFS